MPTEQNQGALNDLEAFVDAVNRVQAVIEFNLDGTIISANDNFLSAVGYRLEEIQGRHHRMFVDPEYAKSKEYKAFWAGLNAGNFDQGQYQRFTKDGDEIWIQASYNPVFDEAEKPYKVVKFATDITAQKKQTADYEGQIDAISRSQAVIEFELDGTIIKANDNFLAATGYTLDEIQGNHHRMFVEKSYGASAEYIDFWQRLGSGQFDSGEYKRITKDGREIWIQASYNPIYDLNGNPFKVVKYATDITDQKIQAADHAGQIEAIGKSQAIIEFEPDGTIRWANENFTNTVGYALDEIVGKHHSMFCEPSLSNSREYAKFWQDLASGEFQAGEFKRVGNGGKEIWIQASYNPILDLNGKPFKVVKYATDITAQRLQNADYEGQIEAIGKAQAVIEFNMDGTIRNANKNFLVTTGYTLDEIVGQHHRIFCDPNYAASSDYKDFWAKLNRGEFDSGEYPRYGKSGDEVWISASYNPIFDLNGKPFKVVKYATNITDRKVAIAKIQEVILAMSKGDLTISIDQPLGEEFAVLGDAMNGLIVNLNGLVGEIRDASNSVFESSRELAQGNADLSKRTEMQASSLEETASAMEELTVTVKQNAENASKATGLSNGAMTKAGEGGEVVENAVSAMQEIEGSSKKISDIIGVIDEIAFQTNLLALNAAVEAARAGEQGRGFAVVAGEVRNLAQRSASAAKEIKDLINDSVGAVGKGSQLVDDTGATFKELVQSVSDVVAMIGDIDTASQEQNAGIKEVSDAVSQMDQMTQQNAALVEEASASSKSMEEKAQSLLRQVAFFNTASTG